MEEKIINENIKSKKRLVPVSNWKALTIFLFGVIGTTIVSLPIIFILEAIYGTDADGVFNELAKATGILNFFTYLISLTALLVFIGLPALKQIFSKIKEWALYEKGIIYGIVCIALQTALSILLTLLFGTFEDNANQSTLIEVTKELPILAFCFTVVFGPIFEELVYRYALFGACYKKNRIFAYVIVGLVFAFIHFDFYAFINTEHLIKEFVNIPPYIAGGLLLCYAYEKEESLLPPIIAHMINNFVGFAQILMIQ